MVLSGLKSKYVAVPTYNNISIENTSSENGTNTNKRRKLTIMSTILVLSSLLFSSFLITTTIQTIANSRKLMRISVDFGRDGACEWTSSSSNSIYNAAESNTDKLFHKQIVIASYPGSDIEVNLEENLKEMVVENDKKFLFSNEISTWKKTHYPHLSESANWVLGDSVIYLIRNPLRAVPAFYDSTHPHHSSVNNNNWIEWRDTHFEDEIRQWAGQINYYMEQGFTGMVVKPTEHPFIFYADDGTQREKDSVCLYRVDCYPKTIVAYEKLRNKATSPNEASKVIASAMQRNKKAKTKEQRPLQMNCMYNDELRNEDFANTQRTFTLEQMNKIYVTLTSLRDKYQGLPFSTVQVSALVSILQEYIKEVHWEKQVMQESEVTE